VKPTKIGGIIGVLEGMQSHRQCSGGHQPGRGEYGPSQGCQPPQEKEEEEDTP